MTTTSTLVLHIDALRPDYVTPDDMPYLATLAANGLSGSVVPPFGFEPDGSYLTGTDPEVYDGGAHFAFSDVQGSIPFSRLAPGLLDRLPPLAQYPFRWAIRQWIHRFGQSARTRASPSIVQIPFSQLRYFAFAEDRYPYEPGFGNGASTVFDFLRGGGLRFFWHGFPRYDCHAVAARDRVVRRLDDRMDLVFALIGDLDVVGHREGPNSDARRRAARRVDAVIAEICDHVSRYCDRLEVVVFGDHGMVEVVDTIDLRGVLCETGLRPGHDFCYFLDSTLARFWYLHEGARAAVEACMATVDGCRPLSDQDRIEYGVRFETRRMGDSIYWLEGGTMLFPSFWHAFGPPNKGMHGYRRDVADNHGAFIFHSPGGPLGEVGSIEMPDVFQTIMLSTLGEEVTGDRVRGNAVQAKH